MRPQSTAVTGRTRDAVVAGSAVVTVDASNSRFEARDARSGEELWAGDGVEPSVPATIAGDLVVVATSADGPLAGPAGERGLAALDLATGAPVDEVVNVGCGTGHTVLEVLDMFSRVTGLDASPAILPRRPGDPAAMVAVPGRAHDVLGWTSREDLRSMVVSAWDGARAASPVAVGARGDR